MLVVFVNTCYGLIRYQILLDLYREERAAMTDTEYLLVVGSIGACIAGLQNTLRAKYVRHLGIHEDVVTVASMMGASAAALVACLAWNHGLPGIHRNFWLPFFITATLNIPIQFWNVKALKLEDASIVAPLSSAQPVFAIAMSWIILHEWPTPLGRLGIPIIAIGSYILALRGRAIDLPRVLRQMVPPYLSSMASRYLAPWLRLSSSKGARLALMSAYVGSIAINFDKQATLASDALFFTGMVFAVVAATVFAESSTTGRWQQHDTRQFRRVFGIGLLMGIGVVFQNAGYYYGIAPYVGALRRTQIMWVVIFSRFILEERATNIRLIASLIIVAGTVLLTL